MSAHVQRDITITQGIDRPHVRQLAAREQLHRTGRGQRVKLRTQDDVLRKGIGAVFAHAVILRIPCGVSRNRAVHRTAHPIVAASRLFVKADCTERSAYGLRRQSFRDFDIARQIPLALCIRLIGQFLRQVVQNGIELSTVAEVKTVAVRPQADIGCFVPGLRRFHDRNAATQDSGRIGRIPLVDGHQVAVVVVDGQVIGSRLVEYPVAVSVRSGVECIDPGCAFGLGVAHRPCGTRLQPQFQVTAFAVASKAPVPGGVCTIQGHLDVAFLHGRDITFNCHHLFTGCIGRVFLLLGQVDANRAVVRQQGRLGRLKVRTRQFDRAAFGRCDGCAVFQFDVRISRYGNRARIADNAAAVFTGDGQAAFHVNRTVLPRIDGIHFRCVKTADGRRYRLLAVVFHNDFGRTVGCCRIESVCRTAFAFVLYVQSFQVLQVHRAVFVRTDTAAQVFFGRTLRSRTRDFQLIVVQVDDDIAVTVAAYDKVRCLGGGGVRRNPRIVDKVIAAVFFQCTAAMIFSVRRCITGNGGLKFRFGLFLRNFSRRVAALTGGVVKLNIADFECPRGCGQTFADFRFTGQIAFAAHAVRIVFVGQEIGQVVQDFIDRFLIVDIQSVRIGTHCHQCVLAVRTMRRFDFYAPADQFRRIRLVSVVQYRQVARKLTDLNSFRILLVNHAALFR